MNERAGMTERTKAKINGWMKVLFTTAVMILIVLQTRSWTMQDRLEERVRSIEERQAELAEGLKAQKDLLEKIWVEVRK